MNHQGFEIREIESFGEIQQCIELQRVTWGMPDVDITPSRLFVIARHGGTPPLGAFALDGRLLGFLHTLSASFEGTPAYYSHMLAVEPTERDKGIGRALKLEQRLRALKSGIPLVVWTFDPLQSRNAHFNINRLGVVVRRYYENFYGAEHASVFDAGIGSDRLFAEWWVGSSRVERLVSGGRNEFEASGMVEIPSDINSIKGRSKDEAAAWRSKARNDIQEQLGFGRYVRGFVFDRERGISRYLFSDLTGLAHETGTN